MHPIRIALLLILSIAIALGHPGGLDANGGHNDRKNGGYHTHGGSSGGASSGGGRYSTPTYTPTPTPTPRPAPAPRPTYTRPRATTPTPTVTRSETRSHSTAAIMPLGYPEIIAPLIDPEKLATLGERAANPRVQKVVALLEQASLQGLNVTNIVSQAVEIAGYTNALLGQMTGAALLHNHRLAQGYGVFNSAGFDEMRRGKSPRITTGAHAGDELSVDHIIPRSKYPELDNVIANLELMPLRMNSKKNDDFGSRQRELLERLKSTGLIK